jgi:3-isopropylmalate/(R)-2-methylmalate dehydratase large subunit
MAVLPVSGRILFLCDDAQRVRRQLAGDDRDPGEGVPLRNGVSTDEITPSTSLTYHDERLGDYVYTGFKAGNSAPIGVGDVRAAGFSVVVAGARYGKGSSREHSPAAELHAGIRLVIAQGFERIYRQNADNVGLFTSTDLGLVPRLQRGEAIEVDELVAGRDRLAAAILRAGGLLRYGSARMGALRPCDAPAVQPRTLVEKILVRHLTRTADTGCTPVPGEGAFIRPDWRFIVDVYTGMAHRILEAALGNSFDVRQPESIIAFADHFSYTHKSPAHVGGRLLPGIRVLHEEHERFVRVHGVRSHGYLRELEGSEGISHPMMTERYALPGEVVVGTDSHTPHSGALGCLAFGVGATDMANAMVTGAVRLTVPQSIRVQLDGRVPPGVSAKDIVLHLLARPEINAGMGVGNAFEFTGPAVASLSLDERATLTNMAAELGAFTGIVAPDGETVRFLREQRGITFEIENWMRSDDDARYAAVIQVDCDALSPMVSAPGDPGNAIPLHSLRDRARIDIAFGGSCTGGKCEDFDAYHAVLAWAAQRGLAVPERVRLYLQFGTTAVRDYCAGKGYLGAFEKVGATVLQPACGACANLGPGASTTADQVTVSTQNRNFPGRSGPGKVWLASPATVAASAIAGELTSFEELRRRADA